VTGNVVSFGASFELYGQNNKDASEPSSFSFPPQLGAVTILKVCKNLLLLDGGRTWRFQKNATFDKPFSWLPKLRDEIQDIAEGDGFYLCLNSSGVVYSFGRNDCGQLGLGHTRNVDVPTVVEKFIELQEKIVQVAAGKFHSAAVTETGRVYVWGKGSEGQIGITPISIAPQLVPRYVNKLQDVKLRAIACGHSFVAALSERGELYTWGSGLTKKMLNVPQKLSSLNTSLTHPPCFIDFEGGASHLAAVTDEGEVFTIGLGTFGQLGLGESLKTEALTRVEGDLKGVQIEKVCCGSFYTVAIARDGRVFTFGSGAKSKLGHGNEDNVVLPRQISSMANFPVSRVGCGDNTLVCLVPTHINTISPTVADSAGGTNLTISGVGLYDTGSPIVVKFVFPRFEVRVEGRYDSFKDCIVLTSPEIDPDLAKTAEGGAVCCEVSVALNGFDFSAEPLHLYIFNKPAPDCQSLMEPSFGPYIGGSEISLTASFDNVPYDNIKVRFTLFTDEIKNKDAPMIEVPARYDASNSCIRFKSPAYGPCAPGFSSKSMPSEWPSLCPMKIDLSLDGQRFTHIGNIFHYFEMQCHSIYPEAIPLTGGPIELLCSGVHFSENITVRLKINGDETVVTGRFHLTSMMNEEEEEEDIAEGVNFLSVDDQQGEGNTEGGETAEGREGEGGEPQDKVEDDCDEPTPEVTVEKTDSAPYMPTVDSLTQAGHSAIGYVWAQLPSFVYYGECDVDLSVSLNGFDYVPLPPQFRLKVASPATTCMNPDCGPVAGGTLVQLEGRHFYHTNNVSLKIFNEVVEVPQLDLPREMGTTTPRAASRGKQIEDEEAPGPVYPYPSMDEKVLRGEYRDRFGNACVEFVVPEAQNPGRVVLLAGFDPHENAFTTNPVPFTYYEPCTVTDVDPATVPLEGGTTVVVNGSGFVKSDSTKVRLTVQVEGAAKSAPVPAKGKAPPKGKASAKGKAEEVEEEPEEKESPVVLPPSVVVPAKYVHILSSEDGEAPKSAGKKAATAKGKKGGTGEDPPAIHFVIPPLSYFAPDLVADGCTCDLELALNGQQFVETGQIVRYDAAGGGKAAAAPKKKK